jgi:capsular polysaccharide biosynthesis protein
VNDPYDTLSSHPVTGDGPPRHLWDNDFTAADEPAAELATGFTSLAFIRAALRRGAKLWLATAVAGLLIGCGLFAKFPPAYQASTTVLLANNPNEDPITAAETDAALARSQTVAEQVVHQLRLRQSVSSFVAASSVTVVTNQVLDMSVGAPSRHAAVVRANALAAAFLQFRARYARAQQQETAAGLDQQVAVAQQRLNSVNTQISQVSAQPASVGQQARLKSLGARRDDASNALAEIKQYATSTLATTKTTTNSMVRDSRVLDRATVTSLSRLKSAALDVAGGLVGGLALGMGIVIVGALMSNRLRRRDEVAEALGAPVRLSVGALAKRSWLLRRASRQDLDLRRVVAHLHGAVPGGYSRPSSLAIAAVDDAHVPARAVALLAVRCANEEKKVVVADLSGDAHLARMLRVKDPGVHVVNHSGVDFVLVLPDREEVAPIGPLHGGTSPVSRARASEAVMAAGASADLLLTLAALDPASGADHLTTWATDVVAVVTAGKSSAERIRGVGEMVRTAGMRLDSAVFIGADKNDLSLGVTPASDQPVQAGPGSALVDR